MVTFTSEADMEELAARTEITVKGRRCLVINPNRREIAVRVHWVPPKVPDELLIRQFERFGRVQRVVREGWQKSGLTHMTGTTRIFHVIPSTPTSLEAIPHQATLNGCRILIEVPGRPSLCLRCYHTGHYRKNCSTPWCRACRAYGHDETNCTQSYASRAKQRTPARNLEEYMDADDMAAMMSTEGPEAAAHPPTPLQASPHVPSPPVNTDVPAQEAGQLHEAEGKREEKSEDNETSGLRPSVSSEPNAHAERGNGNETHRPPPLAAGITADRTVGTKGTEENASSVDDVRPLPPEATGRQKEPQRGRPNTRKQVAPSQTPCKEKEETPAMPARVEKWSATGPTRAARPVNSRKRSRSGVAKLP
ncbi:hypothetical protein HPB48_014938 [Haemaphysalis longicornis]|uniref:CCHC-type domain-containing protein n=1 Tax=Haemaphysalis longicornis TaxID=44386 RepID=A0A9J6FGT2_HAELO|nr:hypothetical protein HPB48_014938 [Haemaphysalis longicornis]